ncbi:MAG: extradiol dioxygenase family protein [Bradymonadia bacterium]|jgi:extradiol dioxygenase family protein
MTIAPFHLAFPILSIADTEAFYCGVLGCKKARQSNHWIDFNFFGHQLSAHVHDGSADSEPTSTVDGKAVPLRHFGVVLPWGEWESLAERLRTQGCTFELAPSVRFEGKAGEQGTFFIRDPSGNALEFKALRDPTQLFSTA